MILVADVFPETPAPKNMARQMSKKPCFRRPLDRQQGKGPKHFWNLDKSTFTIFINHWEGSYIGKSPSFSDTQNPKVVC